MSLDQNRLNVAGVGLACLYVVLAPIMLQSSFDPLLPGRFGHLQLADLLAPVMVLWLWLNFRQGGTRLQSHADSKQLLLLLVFGAMYIASGPLSGILADNHLPLADTLKRFYLVVTLLFFVQVCRIENAPFILLWVSIYTLLLFAGLSLVFYLVYLATGESNFFVHISTSIVFDRAAGQLIGPMRPTEKLFATYLILLSGALFIGGNHLKRPVWLALLALVLVCGILTESRPGALTALFVVLALAATSRRHKIWLTLLALPSLAALAVIEFSAAGNIFVVFQQLRAGEWFPWIPSEGYYLKTVAWKLWMSRPLLGVGPENFVEGWLQAGQDGLGPIISAGSLAETPNSTYLYLLAETGLLGLAGWLGLVVLPLTRLWGSRQEIPGKGWVIVLWAGCLAIAMVDLTITNFRFLYYMIPLIAAIPPKSLGILPQPDL